MKQTTGRYILILVCFLLFFSGCIPATKNRLTETGKKFTIVTSFYPLFLHAINITRGVSGVEVVNMTQPQTGCLHDYQLTAADIRLLERTDVFIVNGAGMETFLDKVLVQLPEIKILEASKGLELLRNESSSADNKNIPDPEELNPHIWVSVSGAIGQVRSIASQLAEIDKAHAQQYGENAIIYINKLESLKERMHKALDGLSNRRIVTFHEAFTYFAREFNLEIAAVVEREPGTEPSAAEMKDTVDKVRNAGVKILFAEPQYSSRAAQTIARETGASVYLLDPVVTGPAEVDDFDAYIRIMDKNLIVLQEALKQ